MKKKLLSALMGASMLIASLGFTGVSANEAPTEAWKNVYTMTQAPADAKEIVYFDGNLPGTNNEVYKITFTATNYQTGVDGWAFKIADADTKAEPFYKTVKKDVNRGSFDETYAFSTDQNPYRAVTEMVVDFSAATPSASVTFYDENMQSFGSKTATLDGIDSLQKIYVDMWSTGNLGFSTPKNVSFKIDQKVDGTWKNEYTMSDAVDGGTTITYFDGNLSGNATYHLTFSAGYFTNVEGGNFMIADGDSEVRLFRRGNVHLSEENNLIDTWSILQGEDNPCTVTADMTIDLNTSAPTAKISFYNKAKELMGSKEVALDGIDSIQKIYYQADVHETMWQIPHQPSLIIDRFVTGTWQDVYTMEEQSFSEDNYECNYFDGNLSGANGEIYKILFTAELYQAGCPGWGFKIADADTTVEPFYKDAKDGFGAIDKSFVFPNDSNPCKVITEMIVDFSSAKPIANITFYDKDKTEFGNKTVTLDGIDSLQKIYVRVWDAWAGTLQYARPKNPSLKISKFTESGSKAILSGATKTDDLVTVDMTLENGGASAMPYAVIAGYFNGNQLIGLDQEEGSVAVGANKSGHVFVIPEEVKGKYDRVTVYLWNSVDGMTPYAAAVDAQ